MTLAVLDLRIGDPQVSLRINGGAVREDEHVLAPGLEQLAGLVEFEDRRFGTAGAGVVLAAMDDIDAAVWRDFDGGHGGPGNSSGRFAPIADSAVGVGKIVDRLRSRLSERGCSGDCYQER